MIRFFDVVLSALGLLVLSPLLVGLYLMGEKDTGEPLFRQVRVGRGLRPFTLIKFRTMRMNTASVATHLASASAITQFGGFLRRTKLDELPQLWNVLVGDMSLVGPRPCLYNQDELIAERTKRGVFDMRPGITGLAQLQGIDMSTPIRLAEVDEKMIRSLSFWLYCSCVFRTAMGRGYGDRVRYDPD